MKKLICMLLAVLCCLSLCACGAAADEKAEEPVTEPAAEEKSVEEAPVEETPVEQEPTGDWRKDTVFSIAGTILQDGEEVSVLGIMDDEGLSLYADSEEQTLIGRLEIGDTYEGAYDALTSYDLSDLDGDGYSDPTLTFEFADGDRARLIWFWSDGSYVLNHEFSTMKGEVSNAG